MSNQGLYYRTQLESKVSLLPEQADADIDDHLLENLRKQFSGKTMENGIVIDVRKIIGYDYGIIDPSNFMTSTIYEVKYECFVCSPIKDLEIICVVESIVKGFIFARNGPVIAAIELNNVDSTKFSISDNSVTHIKDNKKIDRGDYLKVNIINVNSNMGDKHITTICKLLSMATSNEIKQYEAEQKMLSANIIEDTKDFI